MDIDKVFDTFSTDDILKDWSWKGKPLGDEDVANLKAQAKAFAESRLWRILKSEIQWLAIKTLMEKGKEADDIRFAQILGLFTKIIDEKLVDMSK